MLIFMFKKSQGLPLKSSKEYVPPAYIKCINEHDFLTEGECNCNCAECDIYLMIILQELISGSWLIIRLSDYYVV